MLIGQLDMCMNFEFGQVDNIGNTGVDNVVLKKIVPYIIWYEKDSYFFI